MTFNFYRNRFIAMLKSNMKNKRNLLDFSLGRKWHHDAVKVGDFEEMKIKLLDSGSLQNITQFISVVAVY